MTKFAESLNRETNAAAKTLESTKTGLIGMDVATLTAERMERFTRQLAEAEVEAQFWATAARINSYHFDDGDDVVAAQLTEWATEQLMQGADDTWSGRGNDLKRVRFDALRECVRRLRSTLSR